MIKSHLLATTALTTLLIFAPSNKASAMPMAAPVLVGAALSGRGGRSWNYSGACIDGWA